MLGCRASSLEFHELVERLFPGANAPGSAPPNISILAGSSEGVSRAKHALFVNNMRVVITASTGRLARAIVRGIEHTVAVGDERLVEIYGAALVRDGQLIVVDAGLGHAIQAEEPRLRGTGWKRWDSPALLFDRRTSQIVAPPVIDEVDRHVLDQLADEPASSTEAVDFPGFTADAVRWVFPEGDRERPVVPLLRMLRSHVSGRCEGAAKNVAAIDSFMRQGELDFVPVASVREILATILD